MDKYIDDLDKYIDRTFAKGLDTFSFFPPSGDPEYQYDYSGDEYASKYGDNGGPVWPDTIDEINSPHYRSLTISKSN